MIDLWGRVVAYRHNAEVNGEPTEFYPVTRQEWEALAAEINIVPRLPAMVMGMNVLIVGAETPPSDRGRSS